MHFCQVCVNEQPKQPNERTGDLLCQRGAGRGRRTFSPARVLLHRTWPQCGHIWPGGSSGHSHVSLQPLVNCGGTDRKGKHVSTTPENPFTTQSWIRDVNSSCANNIKQKQNKKKQPDCCFFVGFVRLFVESKDRCINHFASGLLNLKRRRTKCA